MSKENSAAILEVKTAEIPLLSKEIIEDETIQHLSFPNEIVEYEFNQGTIPVENFQLYAEEENLPGFVLDIKTTVDSPQRHVEIFETYMSYKITVKSTRPEYSEHEYVVRRRYNDFCWLRNKLVENYQTRLIPPLPSKHSLLGHLDRYAKDFIMFRMVMLNRFLIRVIKHPILSYSECLRIFLTANLTELSSYQKNSGTGFLTKVSGGIYNISLMCQTKEKCYEFEEVKKYITLLTEKLLSFEKIMCRMSKERKELTKDMNHLSLEFERWANSEINLVPLLTSVAEAINNVSTIHDTLLVNTLEFVVLQPVREYLLYIESVKEALFRRDTVQAQYESAIEELHKKKNDQVTSESENRNSIPKSFFDTDKKFESSDVSPKLISTAEINHDKLQIANEDLRSDLERWSVEKKHDIKRILLALSNYYIEYYQKSIGIWEDNLKKINVPLHKE